jgi:ribosome-binding ATPase YchF (GTP1/OBG family)
VTNAGLSDEEKKELVKYGLLTAKPVTVAERAELEDINGLLARAVRDAGYISFFTTGEKETRAWLIRKGVSAWEAAGAIHSDIQRGFIRAEIISFNDFISCGGENAAKQAGRLRLEQKEYVMQDTDLANFRFNK